MIFIACLLICVSVGLWCGFKFDDTRRRWTARRTWDADTGEALAVVNQAAEEDAAFESFMRTRWADQ